MLPKTFCGRRGDEEEQPLQNKWGGSACKSAKWSGPVLQGVLGRVVFEKRGSLRGGREEEEIASLLRRLIFQDNWGDALTEESLI